MSNYFFYYFIFLKHFGNHAILHDYFKNQFFHFFLKGRVLVYLEDVRIVWSMV